VSAARSCLTIAFSITSLTLAVIRDVRALSPAPRPRIEPRKEARALFALIPQSDDFASGNSIAVVTGTAQLTLNPANAYDNIYTVHYAVSVTIDGHTTFSTATLVVAVEANDGSGWVEKATYNYVCDHLSGPPPRPPRTCAQWTHEQKVLSIPGLGLNDNIRLKARSFSTTNGATGSFVIRGGDAGGVNPETYNGVTYTISDGAPVVDASSYNFSKQDYSRCAVACFAAIHQQSTTPYFSLDAPRSVTLVYNSDRVNPRPFVHVNVSPDPVFTETPTEYRLEVKVNGASVTFSNGEMTLRFAYPGAVPARIGGQFDAASYATGVYPMNILVSAVYPGAGAITNDVATKLVVVNDTSSTIAAGWTVAGIQRLYLQSDSSALITEGGGSAVYFVRTGGAYVSPAGEFSQLVTGTPGGGTGWTRRYPDSTKLVFGSTGAMTEIRDRFSNMTSVFYNGTRVSQIMDPLNLAITFTYDGNGLDHITDPMDRVTQVTVDASRHLTLIQDPDVIGTTFGYDASSRLSTIIDRRGSTTTLGYDTQSGKLATITPPAVEVVNADGSLTTASPVTALEAWQKKGVPYGTTSPPAAPPLRDTVYARITDPGGHTTRITVNGWGSAVVGIDALGRTDSTRFDTQGLPIRVRHATGAVDSAVYTSNGLLTYTKPSGLPAKRIQYAGWAQPDSIWTEDGLTGQRNSIGANGRIEWVRVAGGTPDSARTRYRYDTRGRVDSVADPMGHLVQRSWYTGTNGNRSKDSLPGNRVTTYGHDTYGRVRTVSRPGLATTTTHYSIINRADSVQDGVNPVARRYGYDNLFLISVTDPKGQLYGFTYNAMGWLTQRTDPVARSDHFKYSRDGQQRRWTNRRGNVIEYGYDASHRRTIKSGVNTTTDTWAYPSDTVIVAANSVSVDTLVANRHGQLQHVSTVLAGQYYRRRYVYTSAGALDSVIPSGAVAFHPRQYVWNLRRGTLTDIKLGTASTGLASNADGFPQVFTLPGGDQVTLRYTSTHSEADITTSAPYASTVNRYLTFNTGSRIDRQILGSGVDGHEFDYDGLGRLKTVGTIRYADPSNPCTGNPPPDVDENGNVCTYEGTWITDSLRTFDYDSVGNRRDEGGSYLMGNRITAFAGCSYQTDDDGNVTQRACPGETVTFVWSAEGRLSGLTFSGQTTLFDYNAAGRLVRKTTGGIANYFLWERDNPLAELDGAGTGKIAEYSYYPGLDNPHALIVGTTKYFAHRDGLGNTIALTDSGKALSRTYSYDAWGRLTGGTDYAGFVGVDRVRFKGALSLGSDLDLYYMRARWYEPKTGRFLNEDPVGLAGGINPYVFAASDPVNNSDPSGNWCIQKSPDVLHCEDVNADDLWTIERFLGRPAGLLRRAWERRGWPVPGGSGEWGDQCRGGFSNDQCSQLAEVHANLTLHRDPLCRRLGTRATQRFQRGEYRLHQGILGTNSRGDILGRAYPHVLFWGGTTVLTSEIFGTAQYAYSRQFLVAHEETHHLLISEGILNGIFGEGPAIAAGTRCM
jgi:RHS repeat-associated protein